MTAVDVPNGPGSTVLNQVTIDAFSAKTERLAYTIALPPVTLAWVRALLNIGPRAAVYAMYPLNAHQLAIVQKMIEMRLEPKKFTYDLDGDSVARNLIALAKRSKKKK